jgi:hypothetical protein
MDSAALLDLALTAPSRAERRHAFVAVAESSDWRMVLAPHVISQQGYQLSDGHFPDRITFAAVAKAITSSEEKIQHVLELLGSRFALDVCEALARHMGESLVEHALPHLRTAQAERALLLEQVLTFADRRWVARPEARRSVRQKLRSPESVRLQVIELCAEAGNLADFADALREHPPVTAEEWNAVGKGKLSEPLLVDRALALLPTQPEVISYLLRLDPLPDRVPARLLAAARPDWLVQALEVAIIFGVQHPSLVPLAELGARLGGRPLAAATAWLSSARLGKQLLGVLGKQIIWENGRSRLSDMLWLQRRPASANRALEDGRAGRAPDQNDAAALIRQLRGEKILELVHEILTGQRPVMMEAILHPLCAVNAEAATELATIARAGDGDAARRARKVRGAWNDVLWPPDPVEE